MTTSDDIVVRLRCQRIPGVLEVNTTIWDIVLEAADTIEAERAKAEHYRIVLEGERSELNGERALADDLATKIATATAAWDAEDVQERNDLSDDFWRAMGGLFGALTSYRAARA